MLILKGYEIKYQTMGYSVMVARLILVQSVRVQILVPQPYFDRLSIILDMSKDGPEPADGHMVSLYIRVLR